MSSLLDELEAFLKQADNYTQDTREWPDPTDPRASKPPAQKGCTCNVGHKLDCPVHGLDPTQPDLARDWSVPENSPVGYPQDQPRNWTQASEFVVGNTSRQPLEVLSDLVDMEDDLGAFRFVQASTPFQHRLNDQAESLGEDFVVFGSSEIHLAEHQADADQTDERHQNASRDQSDHQIYAADQQCKAPKHLTHFGVVPEWRVGEPGGHLARLDPVEVVDTSGMDNRNEDTDRPRQKPNQQRHVGKEAQCYAPVSKRDTDSESVAIKQPHQLEQRSVDAVDANRSVSGHLAFDLFQKLDNVFGQDFLDDGLNFGVEPSERIAYSPERVGEVTDEADGQWNWRGLEDSQRQTNRVDDLEHLDQLVEVDGNRLWGISHKHTVAYANRTATTLHEHDWDWTLAPEAIDPDFEDRRPLIYDRNRDVVHVGQPGMFHSDLADALPVEMMPEGNEAMGWVGHDPYAFGGSGKKVPYGGWYTERPIPDSVHQALERFAGHRVADSQHQLWHTPGEWGRGLIHPNGTVYTWPEEEATHAQMARSLGIEPFNYQNHFEVYPEGQFRMHLLPGKREPTDQWNDYIEQATGLTPTRGVFGSPRQQLQATAAFDRSWLGPDMPEEWQPGTWGKGLELDGHPVTWQTDPSTGSPHHYDVVDMYEDNTPLIANMGQPIVIHPSGYATHADSSAAPWERESGSVFHGLNGIRYVQDENRWQQLCDRWDRRFASAEHKLWFEPHTPMPDVWDGPIERGAYDNEAWGRGWWHKPTQTLYTWPESEGTHSQVADVNNFVDPFASAHALAIRPDGTVTDADGDRQGFNEIAPAIAQADPRLKPVQYAATPEIEESWEDFQARLRASERDQGFTSHTAGETANQELRRWKMLNERYPSSSAVEHEFPDGWTIQSHPVKRDTWRVGAMMRNCWQGGANAERDLSPEKYEQLANKPHVSEYGLQFMSLHDPTGIPRVAFNYKPSEGITSALGMRNTQPPYEHLERIGQWQPFLNPRALVRFRPAWDQPDAEPFNHAYDNPGEFAAA